MKIEVTQDDIKKGKPQLSDSCPIALSLRRSLVKAGFSSAEAQEAVRVCDDSISICISYPTPPKAAAFIEKVDNAEKDETKPFVFNVKDGMNCQE